MYPSNRKWLRSPSERVGSLADADLPPPAPGPVGASDDEQLLVKALRERDEGAFEMLLDQFHSPLLRLARTFVRSREEAEEVVQDTWMAVLSGVNRFEHRSSLKTWVFRILANRARTRARREARMVPFSTLAGSPESTGSGEMPDPGWPFHVDPPLSWEGRPWEPPRPDDLLLADELVAHVDAAIQELPARQREVITLRDIEGWSADEVCELLDLSESNQRVLLHRARSAVRDALEDYLAPPSIDAAAAFA